MEPLERDGTELVLISIPVSLSISDRLLCSAAS